MLIDIHRHAKDPGAADFCLQNLFHTQRSEITGGRYFTLGLHPWHVKEESIAEDLAMIREAAEYPQVLAIGESGLDKSNNTPLNVQMEAFEGQVKIAVEVNKPMIIHCVRAYNEVLQMKKKIRHKKPWIIHWFNASAETADQLLKKDFYLSFGHMLFNEQSKAYSAFPHIDISRIFFETDDASYSIAEVYERAVQIKGLKSSELEKQIRNNFQQCFGLKL